MSDQKDAYSDVSSYYVEVAIRQSEEDCRAHEASKRREEKYNENWLKQKVNINEICDEFAPGDMGRRVGHKYVFEGPVYTVECDMSAGYLRIRNRVLRCYVRLDGTPDRKQANTHFKIKRREEM